MADQRYRLSYRLRYALRNRDGVVPYLRRWWRDRRFRLTGARDHVSFYRAVMRDDAGRNPEAAVGSATHDRWLALGALQFEYLLEHGLQPEHDVLEIGCGDPPWVWWRLLTLVSKEE
ncbi:MAG: hypothetical protein JJT89_17620, partial [Nitriliruptoraceae bacterium]|nr:hypothetical protein [Nitriliruptoraceae bacterium]